MALLRTIMSFIGSLYGLCVAYGVFEVNPIRMGPHAWTRHENWGTRYADFYMPNVTATTRYVLAFVHGGGWHSGTKGDEWWIGHAFMGRAMASYGIPTLVVTYPIAPVDPVVMVLSYVLLAIFAVVMTFVCSAFTRFVLSALCGRYALQLRHSYKTYLLWWSVPAVVCFAFCAHVLYAREFSTPSEYAQHPAQVDSITNTLYMAHYSFLHEYGDEWPHTPKWVLAGHSAGGHLAALAAIRNTHDDFIRKVVGISGPYDMVRLWGATADRLPGFVRAVVRLVCLGRAFTDDTIVDASPMHQVPSPWPNMPKHTLITALYDADELIYQADQYAALTNAKRIRNVGFGHGLGLVHSQELVSLLVAEVLDA